MTFPLIKRKRNTSEIINECLYEDAVYYHIDDSNSDETYFNLKVVNKEFPDCYQYNLAIMVAKNLIRKENEKIYSNNY